MALANASRLNIIYSGSDGNWSSGTGQNFIRCADSAEKFIVRGDGDAENTNNSYGAISDVKLKENIVDATPKLDDLMKVSIRHYNLIGDDKKQIGVIAQELEQVFSGLVKESPDIDDKGQETGETTKSVKYSVFVPMLIKAMQEQQALIEAQATTIIALTARITALENGE